MDIEQIRSVLTNKINPKPLSELDENELASVLIVIYGKEPIILMTEKAKTLNGICVRRQNQTRLYNCERVPIRFSAIEPDQSKNITNP